MGKIYETVERAHESASRRVIIGDFNVNFLPELPYKLNDVVFGFNLTNIITEPTRVTVRSHTLIDQ